MRPAIPETLPPSRLEWEPLIPLIGRTNRALATYNGVLMALPNPKILLSSLTTQEAVLSSRIEGTTADLREVLAHEAGDNIRDSEKIADIGEIINYRKALNEAVRSLTNKPFGLNMLRDLHSTLMAGVRGENKSPGEFRAIQNYIGRKGATIEQADYVPPEVPVMKQALHDWETFYHKETPDPLVQLALLHAQFEKIHPFLDGNGRIGRILIPLFLYDRALIAGPWFFISAYFEEHRDTYIEKLRDIDNTHGWNDWIVFFLTAMEMEAQRNTAKATAIQQLYEKLKLRVIEITHSQYAVPLLDILFKYPIVSTTAVAKTKGMPSRPMVTSLLNDLREDGILKIVHEGAGRRAHVLALAELIKVAEGKKVI